MKESKYASGGIVRYSIPLIRDNGNYLPRSMMEKLQASLDKPFDESKINIHIDCSKFNWEKMI